MSITFGKKKKRTFPLLNQKLCTNIHLKTPESHSAKNYQYLNCDNDKSVKTQTSVVSKSVAVEGSSPHRKSTELTETSLNCQRLVLEKSPNHKSILKNASNHQEDFTLKEVLPNLKTYSRPKVNTNSNSKLKENMDLVKTSIVFPIEDDHLQVKNIVDLRSINMTSPSDEAMSCYGTFGDILSHGLGECNGSVNFPADFSEQSICMNLRTENKASPLSSYKALKTLLETDSEITDEESTNSDVNQNLSSFNDAASEQEEFTPHVRKKSATLTVKFPKMKVLKKRPNLNNVRLKSGEQSNVDVKKSSVSDHFDQSISSDKMKDGFNLLQNDKDSASSSKEINPCILFSNETEPVMELENQSSVKQKSDAKIMLAKSETVESENLAVKSNQSKINAIDLKRNNTGINLEQFSFKHDDKDPSTLEDGEKQILTPSKKTEGDVNESKQSKMPKKWIGCVPNNVQCNIAEEKSDQAINNVDSVIQSADLVTDKKDPKLSSQSLAAGEKSVDKEEECKFSCKQIVEKRKNNLIAKSEVIGEDKKGELMLNNQAQLLLKQKPSKENLHISPDEKQALSKEQLAQAANNLVKYLSKKLQSVKDEGTELVPSSTQIDTITTKPNLINKWHSASNNQIRENDKAFFSTDQSSPLKFVIGPCKVFERESSENVKPSAMQPVVSLINFVSDTNKFTKQLKNLNECHYVYKALKYFDEWNNEGKQRNTEIHDELAIESIVQHSASACTFTSDDNGEISSKLKNADVEKYTSGSKQSRKKKSPQGKVMHSNLNHEPMTGIEFSEEKDKEIDFSSPESKKSNEAEEKQLKTLNNIPSCLSVQPEIYSNTLKSDGNCIINGITCAGEVVNHIITQSNSEGDTIDFCADSFTQSNEQEFVHHKNCIDEKNKGECISDRRRSPRKKITQGNENISGIEAEKCEEKHSKSNENIVINRKENVFSSLQKRQQSNMPKIAEAAQPHSENELKQTTVDMADCLKLENKQSSMKSNCRETKKISTESELRSGEVNKNAQLVTPKANEKSISLVSDIFCSNVKKQYSEFTVTSTDEARSNMNKIQYLKNFGAINQSSTEVKRENSKSVVSKRIKNQNFKEEEQKPSKLNSVLNPKSFAEIKAEKAQNKQVKIVDGKELTVDMLVENSPFLPPLGQFYETSTPKCKMFKQRSILISNIGLSNVDEEETFIQHGLNELPVNQYLSDTGKDINNSAKISSINNEKLNEIHCNASYTSKINDTLTEESFHTLGSSASTEESVSEAECHCSPIQKGKLLGKVPELLSVSDKAPKSDCVSSYFLKSLQLLPKDIDDINFHKTSPQRKYKRPSVHEIAAEHIEEEEEKSLLELQRQKRSKKGRESSPNLKKYQKPADKNENKLTNLGGREAISSVNDNQLNMISQICNDKHKSYNEYEKVEFEAKLPENKISFEAEPANVFCKISSKNPVTFADDSDVQEFDTNSKNGSKEEGNLRKKRKKQQKSIKADSVCSISSHTMPSMTVRVKRKHFDSRPQMKTPKRMFLGKQIRNSSSFMRQQLSENDSESEESKGNKIVTVNLNRFSDTFHHAKTGHHDFKSQIINEKGPKNNCSKKRKVSNNSAMRDVETQTSYDAENLQYVPPNAVKIFNPYIIGNPQYALPYYPYQFINSPLNPYSSLSTLNSYQISAIASSPFQQASGLVDPFSLNARPQPCEDTRTINISSNTQNSNLIDDEDGNDSHTHNAIVLRKRHDIFTDFMYFNYEKAFLDVKCFVEANKTQLLKPYMERKDLCSKFPVRAFCTSPIVKDTFSKLTCSRIEQFPVPALIEFTFKTGFEDRDLLSVVKDYVKFHFIHLKGRYALELESGLFNSKMLTKYIFENLNLKDTIVMRFFISEQNEKYTVVDMYLIFGFSALLSIYDEYYKRGGFIRK